MNRDLSAYDKQITKNDIIEYTRINSNIFRRSPELGLVLIVFICFFSFPIVVVAKNNIASPPYWYLFLGFIVFFAITFGFLAWTIYFDTVKTRIYLEQIARANGLNYFPEGLKDQPHAGFIFNIGHSKTFRDTLTFSDGANYEISNYRYTVGSGKNKKTVELGYAMIKLDRKLPHMVLDSLKNNFNFLGLSVSNLPVSFKGDQVLSLEGDFDKYFKLFAPKDYETDALYVFNPQLMALFIDESSDYDAEIVDDCLYVYSSKPFDFKKRETLDRLFRIVDTVMQKTAYSTRRYSDSEVSNFATNQVGAGGVRLRKNLQWFAIVISIIMFLLAIYSIIEPFLR